MAADTGSNAVILHTSTCAAAREDAELRQALEIELAAMHVEPHWPGDAGAPSAARVSLSTECDDDTGAVWVRVWSSAPRLVTQRSVALRDVPESARVRTLALVISEALGPALDGAPVEDAVRPRNSFSHGASASLGGALFTTADPSAPWGPLFTTTDPYAMHRELRVGASAQARLVGQEGNLLLAFELGASGPLTHSFDWGLELSHASGKPWTSEGELDVSWFTASLGPDLISAHPAGFSLGPRLSVAHLSISQGSDTERTLITQLGGRGRLDLPLGEGCFIQVAAELQHTLGVLALTPYTGFDRALDGWRASWGVGLAVEL